MPNDDCKIIVYPGSIGSPHWPGISKLLEEAGEVAQVAGKIIGANGQTIHFDGSDLRVRLVEELADLSAAIEFVLSENDLNRALFRSRAEKKLTLFRAWHADQRESGQEDQ